MVPPETPSTAGVPPLSTCLQTERLLLRPPRTSDLSCVQRALRRNAGHLQPWSAAPANGEDPASLTGVSRTILRDRAEWKAGRAFALWVFALADEDLALGRVALGAVHRGAFQNAYLGYWIDAQHQRRGLMTEAVRATTRFALTEAGLHRVQAAVMPENLASQKVLEKLGFRREGLAERYLCIAGAWRDHLLYALTADEWAGGAR
jgi:ribosomal-protein-alanine N-acetyltransferase